MEINTSGVANNEIMGKWEDIGIQLDIADEELTAIRRGYTDYVLAFQYMIRFWVKQVNPPPTWSKFVEALERLNRFQKLTDQLRSKYCGTWQSYYRMVDNLHAWDTHFCCFHGSQNECLVQYIMGNLSAQMYAYLSKKPGHIFIYAKTLNIFIVFTFAYRMLVQNFSLYGNTCKY